MKFSLSLLKVLNIFKFGFLNLISPVVMFGFVKFFSQANEKSEPNKFPAVFNFFTFQNINNDW